MHFICTLVGKRLIYVAKMNTCHNLPQIMCVRPLVVTMFLLFHFCNGFTYEMCFIFSCLIWKQCGERGIFSAAYIKAVTRNFHAVDCGVPCGQKCYERHRPPAVTLTSAHLCICFESKQASKVGKLCFIAVKRDHRAVSSLRLWDSWTRSLLCTKKKIIWIHPTRKSRNLTQWQASGITLNI